MYFCIVPFKLDVTGIAIEVRYREKSILKLEITRKVSQFFIDVSLLCFSQELFEKDNQ